MKWHFRKTPEKERVSVAAHVAGNVTGKAWEHINRLSEEDQDKFIQFFELMSFRGNRAYPTPDLYIGASTIDIDFCQEILGFLHKIIQSRHEAGWKDIR